MDSTLKYRVAGDGDNFDAWGVGLFYSYKVGIKQLDVFIGQGDEHLLTFKLRKGHAAQAQRFVHYFDRAAQVKALMLSNHGTTNIAETMAPDRLRGVLNNTYNLSCHAHDLHNDNLRLYVRLTQSFYQLRHFSLKHLVCPTSGNAYYRAGLKTHSQNEVIARSMTLHGVLMTLSEKIVRDLIALEFSTRHNTAYNLLTLSAQLSTISRVLNDHFYPSQKVKAEADEIPPERLNS